MHTSVADWDALSPYELRHLPGHLVLAARTADATAVGFDLSYHWSVLGRLDLTSLVDAFGVLESGAPLQASDRALAGELRRLLRAEAAFVEHARATDAYGAFVNHLVVAAARESFDRPAKSLTWDAGGLKQAGWLVLETIRGPRRAAIGMRFFMKAERRAYAWDVYDAGPMGAKTTFSVDLQRLRLLGENVSMYHYGFGDHRPERYHWRIWDLRSGALLEDRSAAAVHDRPHHGGLRPVAFEREDLIGLDGSRRAGADIACVNGPERLSQKEAAAAMPAGVEPELLVRIDERLALLGRGEDQHIYLTELGPARDGSSLEGPEPAPVERIYVVDDCGVAWLEEGMRWRFDPVTRRTDETPDAAEPLDTDGWRWHAYDHRLTTYGAAIPADFHLESPHPASGYGRAPGDDPQEVALSPAGAYVLEKRAAGIGVWERATGTWLGTLADRSYGPGGLLQGWAVTPDDRRLASARDGGQILVWHLDDRSDPYWHAQPREPDWRLADVQLEGKIERLAFLWGGWLLAAATDQQQLAVLRFWHSSAVLAWIGLEEEITHLVGTPYGDTLFCLGRSGRLTRYRFCYLPGPDVSALAGSELSVRFRAPEASAMGLAGSFTDWQPRALERDAHGIWQGRYQLSPGAHDYKLVVDEHRWELDPHVCFRPGAVGMDNYVHVVACG